MLLDINIPTILFTAANLLVLYLLLKKFLFGPVTAMIDGRAKEIETSLSDAAGQRDEAARLKADCEARLARAREDAEAIAAQGRERGQREYEALLAQARNDAEKLLADTRAQLDAERGAMLQAARQQVAALALLAAAKVSRRELDAQGDRELVDALLSDPGALQ